MCLMAEKNKGVQIAETDIDVFKVFRVKEGFMHRIYTGPYREFFSFWDLNGLYTCKGFDDFTFDNQPCADYAFKTVYCAFGREFEEQKRKEIEEKSFIFVGFHSFKNLQDALKEIVFLKFYNTLDEKEYDVLHCTIPKGTKYYEGLFDGKECYCSEQIKLNCN